MPVETQVDLFLDQMIDAPVKDDRALMEFPFFSLQKQPRHKPFEYDDGNIQITVEPGPRGIATIWDKDVMIYLASLINDRQERGAPLSSTIQFSAHDFLKSTGRGTGKRAYELFLDALFRLRSTTVVTNIKSDKQTERRGFGWLNTWKVLERTLPSGKVVMAAVEVEVPRWIFDAVTKDNRVLTINRDYFGLKKGLERRLYELVRKHCGRQAEWVIGLERLYEKCGSTGRLRQFRLKMKEISQADTIPDYHFFMYTADKKELVKFVRDKPPAKPRLPEVIPPEALEDAPLVTQSAFDQVQTMFPAYNTDSLERQWQEWTKKNGVSLKNNDEAFIAFCKKHVERNPL